MKPLAGISLLLFVGLGSVLNGQTPAPPAPASPASPALPALPALAPKALVETSVVSEKIVKGSPFSAEAVNESVQTLADGNRIVHSSTNKLYRNSEGRFRREISGGAAGSWSSFYSVGPGVTILDPVAGYRYLLDSQLMTARVGSLGPGVVTTVKGVAGANAVRVERLQTEQKLAELRATAPVIVAAKGQAEGEGVRVVTTTPSLGGTFVYNSPARSKYETRTEELGTQSIEGVDAVGTRTITTIPAGDIGNEKPIEIVYERWYSNELQLVVMSKHNDPRFGEQTYRLTNIVRSEPDPALFEVPPGYKVVSGAAGGYTLTTGRPTAGGQNVVWTKASGSGTTSVRSTKP